MGVYDQLHRVTAAEMLVLLACPYEEQGVISPRSKLRDVALDLIRPAPGLIPDEIDRPALLERDPQHAHRFRCTSEGEAIRKAWLRVAR